MRRTQLYIPEEYYTILSSIAQKEDKTISEEVRRAIAEYLKKRASKKERVISKKEARRTLKDTFADMIGIFSGPKDASQNVDEIYDED